MPDQSTPFPKSWGLHALAVLTAWIIGPAMAYFGYYGLGSEETVIVVLSGAALLAGPMLVVAAPFMPRPSSGPCPLCGAKMYSFWQAADALLVCPSCAACATASNETLTLLPMTNVADVPAYPAALPWDDVVENPGKTVAFSAQDVAMDKLSELITRNAGVRVIDKWPPGCSVCGAQATQSEAASAEVLIKGRALETKATLLAHGIPHCAAHSNGVAFGRVEFAGSPTEGDAFGLKFRSHAYREAFRKLNPHKFDRQANGPLKIRTA